MENQIITPKIIKKHADRTKFQAARLEMIADELGVSLNKEMDQIFTALSIICIKLSYVVHPDGSREKYRKLSTKKERNRLTKDVWITTREHFYASFQELESALGEPLYKTENSHFEWAFASPNANIFTLHDGCISSEGFSLKDKEKIQDSKKFKWSIGAKWTANVADFIGWLKEKVGGQEKED